MEELVQIGGRRKGPRLPGFLRKPQSNYLSVQTLKNELRRMELNTVCESARCPNMHECFHRGAATFMIMGNLCTRGCTFCSVPKGSAAKQEFRLDADEPANVAAMAQRMGLRYVVITSVNRDDLADGGSAHFAETVRRVRGALPEARIEVLTPDFCGDLRAVERVLEAGPDVFNHNMETVERLYKTVRPQADYGQSLRVLAHAKDFRPEVDIVTIGQYLQPTRRNRPVAEYVPEDRYERWKESGRAMGFKAVFAGPFVRSSYMADVVNEEAERCGERTC